LFTFDCAVVYYNNLNSLMCMFWGVQLPWQPYRIIATHLVIIIVSQTCKQLSIAGLQINLHLLLYNN